MGALEANGAFCKANNDRSMSKGHERQFEGGHTD